MAFTFILLIEKAYYLSNILSERAGETPSTVQLDFALDYINIIYDKLRNNAAYNQYPDELKFAVNTRFVYIGKNIISSDSDVTVIDEDYFSVITGASTTISGTTNKSLTVLGMRRRFALTFTNKTTVPQALYYTTKIQNNVPYTEIFVEPIPILQYPITIFGNIGLTSENIGTGTIRPQYFMYVLYELASFLSDANGKADVWKSSGKEARRMELYRDIMNQVDIDTTFNNDGDKLFGRGEDGILDGLTS